MVAPIRTPQARGVKCDLCKKILTTATWLDQTKLAKDILTAKSVLKLIDDHMATSCPCIPKSIENLLIGSTEFEIHRLLFKSLDAQVHKRQTEYWLKLKSRSKLNESSQVINDCYDGKRTTRFNLLPDLEDDVIGPSKEHLKHLKTAIDFWQIAMEDEANQFNSKLALRLGLTHHVIYACYLFKYYKILDYQLIASNLLLNLFKSIESVTDNAILHALFLLIRTLVDCGQLYLARIYLKQAQKMSNYNDKSSYESILVTSVACELDLLEDGGSSNPLEELVDLVTIRNDDKLQHYYARTLAMGTLLRYIHLSPLKSYHCFEFFHTYRYTCAIVRRCYESSFDLILNGTDIDKQTKADNLLDHNWIRYATCDLAFSTFDLLFQFYSRAGIPECIEILYNGLGLISFRNNSSYWQSRVATIGIELDVICSKLEHAKNKLDTLASVINKPKDLYLEKHLETESQFGALLIANARGEHLDKKEALAIIDRIQANEVYLLNRICNIELYDCTKSRSRTKCDIATQAAHVVSWHRKQCLKIYAILLRYMFNKQDRSAALNLIDRLKAQLDSSNSKVTEYYDSQTILEMLLHSTSIDSSDSDLLDVVSTSNLFLHDDNSIYNLGSQLSSLNLLNETRSTKPAKPIKRATKSRQKLSLSRRSRRGSYEVANKLQQTLLNESDRIEHIGVFETLDNIRNMTTEEVVVSYLRNSEPNPNYLLYRKAHEVMFRIRLAESQPNHEHLLYHFTESCYSTIRYRWMMYEEQQISPYDCKSSATCASGVTKNIGFSNTINNIEKQIRQFTRTIPEDQRLLQLKYVLDKKQESEHLIMVMIDNSNAPVYIHTSRGLYSHNFFSEQTVLEDTSVSHLYPSSLLSKISAIEQESKKTLFLLDHSKRTDVRQRLETDLGVLLQEFEDEFLGAFRFLTCGSLTDTDYNRFIQRLVDEIVVQMTGRQCKSRFMLKLLVENAPLISRSEFCSVIATLFSCKANSDESKDVFTKWQKSMEVFLTEHKSVDVNKVAYCQKLDRAPVGLLLDCDLEHIPFESLPSNRISKQGIFRMPSLRVYSVILTRLNNKYGSFQVDSNQAAYLLDPANNLSKTRERFEPRLKSKSRWCGVIGHEPRTDALEEWLSHRDIYLFIGHGSGTAYYNKLCNNRGLSYMSAIRPVSIVMGCSSGKLQREGPHLEPFGIGWVFVLRGSPAYVGLLWDVTDTDIDKFLDSLLCYWLTSSSWTTEESSSKSALSTGRSIPLTNAVALARAVCRYKHLVGSTPIVYGLPVWLRSE